MRKLALFSGAFALGIFLAQYLPGSAWQPLAAAGCFLAALLALALPGLWRRRGLLALCGLSLAFGWNWLYARQVQAPLEALAGTEQTVTMTLCDYATATDYGAKVTVKLEGYPLGKVAYYGDEALLDLSPGQTVTDLVSFQSAARHPGRRHHHLYLQGRVSAGIPERGAGIRNRHHGLSPLVARPGRSRSAAADHRTLGPGGHRCLHDRHPDRRQDWPFGAGRLGSVGGGALPHPGGVRPPLRLPADPGGSADGTPPPASAGRRDPAGFWSFMPC